MKTFGLKNSLREKDRLQVGGKETQTQQMPPPSQVEKCKVNIICNKLND